MDKKTKELNRLNNELDAKVEAQNQKAFTEMICYIRGADISEYDQEVVRQDLLEMILSAQERGEDIRSVIGEDYKGFCDDVIASLAPKTAKQKWIDFFDMICWCLSILGAINIIVSRETIELIENVVKGQPLNFDISVSVGDVVACGIIIIAAVIIVECITKNPFKEIANNKGRVVKGLLIGIITVFVFLLIVRLGEKTLFAVNIFVACLVVIALYIVHKLLERL